MLQLDERVTMQKAASMMATPAATLRGWKHHGRIPSKAYDVADVLSLFTAKRLTVLGLDIAPAASIAWAIRGEWQHIVKRSSPVYLLVTRTGEAVPFEWSILTPEQLAVRHNASASYVNLQGVVLEVRHKLSAGHG